ncbi:MAG: HlyD family efflux transporter periplasmic adaptor subunit [Candidatus Eremiobacteraeota bacterium]|nr:HlyD family efflux transporter periplasmic adaptor subunit [Candidatus Eremiobacteraeota bacterium]
MMAVDTQQAGGMDVPRAPQPRNLRLAITIGFVVVAVLLLIFALPPIVSRNSGTVVDKGGLITDTARIGTIERTVDGSGTFVPEHIRIASATQPGVVDSIFVKAGSRVARGTVIAQLDNPELQAAVANASSAVAVSSANLVDARQQASASIVASQSALNDARAVATSDAIQAKAFATMLKKGLVPDLTYRQAQIEADKSANDLASKVAELRLERADADAKIASSQAQLQRAEGDLEQARSAVGALTVRSAADGIIQAVDVDPGSSVPQNTAIVKIADPNDLKVVLSVAEADAATVAPLMTARIDTGSGTLQGFVTRIAPSAQNGTVAIDIGFRDPRSLKQRLDASVSGRIVVSQIRNALSITRPANAVNLTTIDLFKVIDGGARAERVHVSLGRGASDRVEVLSGLMAGDTVIVSDMSNYLDRAMLRLH